MKRSDEFPEIREIADAICSNTATLEQKKSLEQRLSGNFEAQRFYYDYISIHIKLQSAAEHDMEFIYRRMTEEFVVRPKNSRDNADTHTTDNSANTHTTDKNEQHSSQNEQSFAPQTLAGKPKLPSKIKLISVGVVFILLIVAFIWFLLNRSHAPFNAHIIRGHLSIAGHGYIDKHTVFSGEYLVEQSAVLTLPSGDDLHLDAHSIVKLFNGNEIQLKRGVLKVVSRSGNNIMVHGPSFTVYSNGDDLAIDLTQQSIMLTTGQDTLLLPNRWRPNHFWPFESDGEHVIDAAGSLYGKPSKQTKRTKGLLGQGAYYFNNHSTDRIIFGSGGGTVPATGSFAASDGVTIEVLIRPEYSGDVDDRDQIFSKDAGNDELRMVLGFQNDSNQSTLELEENVNESLEFGLYVLGQGYHRLKLALDGIDGRPSLAQLTDGNMHHVVGSYSAKSGLKAIYIDGKMLARYQYPPGSKIITGGPGKASIGNTQGKNNWKIKSFSGEIDEVAFYDFALTDFIVKQHWHYAQQGKNYFGLPPSADLLPQQISLTLPPLSTIELDTVTGLPTRVIDQ